MADIIRLTPKEIRDAQNILDNMPEEDSLKVFRYFTTIFLNEVRAGINGDVDYEKAPLFKLINEIYIDLYSTGCYFCDPEIDPNELEFSVDRNICASCHLKLRNLFQAFEIDINIFPPWMLPVSKVQKTKYVKNYDYYLNRIESSIRLLIHEVLSNTREDYWGQLIPENIRDKVEERIKYELSKNPWEREKYSSNEEKLNFFDLLDYSKIIKKNWKIFRNHFGSRTTMHRHFENLSELRNCIKHGRKVNEVSKKLGEAAMDWFDSIFMHIIDKDKKISQISKTK